MSRASGQTLAAFALLLPLVLLPVLAYGVEASLLSTRAARLEAAAGRAAEDASSAIDVGALRAGGGLLVDPALAAAVAASTLAADDPQAVLDGVAVAAGSVTVSAHELVPAGFAGLVGWGAVTIRAAATARIRAGYVSPSSLMPLPKRSLSMTG